MTFNQKEKPECFGDLDTVFPLGRNGLRETPEHCLACQDKTRCLQAALEDTPGLRLQEEFVDRAYQSGIIGFYERWSRKKILKSRMKPKPKAKRSERTS